MFQFYTDFEREGLETRDIDRIHSLNPKLRGLDILVNQNKDLLSFE